MKFTATLLFLLFLSLGISAQKPDSSGINPDSLTEGFSGTSSQFGTGPDLSKLMGPNVAAFEKRARIPVSYNTGQVNLSIPLMNLVIDDYLQIPVALPYANSGLKPAEVPSSTGNGWNLPLGGTIVQYFKGLDDLGSLGLQIPLVRNNLDNYTNGVMTPTERYNYLWEVASQNLDSQFDNFSLNFGNRSNQFYFDKSDIKLFNQEQLKITFASDVFTVTDEMGYQYIFGIKKLSTGNYTDEAMGGKIFTEGTTTWFLTKIITPHAQEVVFTYQDDITYEIYELVKSFTMGHYVVNYRCFDEYFYKPSFSETQRTISQYLLKGVQYPGGKLEMQYIDRQDLQSPNGVKSKALAAIRHRNINNEVIAKAAFQYHYMHPASQDRLMLSSVALSGKDTTFSEVFSFEYYPSTVAVPIPGLVKPGGTNAANNGIDFNDYFNGSTANTDKIPTAIYPENHIFTTGPSPAVGGANRNPDPQYSKMGMLRKITWPDKGYEEFFYEPNTYNKAIGSLSIFETGNASTLYENIMQLGSAHCDTVVQNFTLATTEVGARVRLNAEAKSEPVTLRLKKTSASGYVINSTFLPSEDIEQLFYVALDAGTYQSEILAGCNSPGGFASAWVTIERPSAVEREIITGGNRIMKIKRYPVSGQPDIRRISYSWGRDTAPFQNWHRRTMAYDSYMGNYCGTCEDDFVVRSNNIYTYEGFHVQYRQVDERSHLNGKSNYHYLTWPQTGEFPTVEDYRSRLSFPWRHGLLLGKSDLRKMDRIANNESHVYRQMKIPPWKGLGLLAKFKYHCPTAQGYGTGATFNVFSTGIVPVYTDTTGLLKTIRNYYNDFSSVLYSDSTIYEYNSRWQLYRVSNSRSDGGLNTQTSYYADDFSNSASPNIATLKAKHIIGKPLKSITTINGNTAYGEVGTPNVNGNIFAVWRYESDVNHNPNPAVLTGSDFTQQEVRFYNSKGKLSGFAGRDGITYVYLWSYNFTHPVALIANATEAEVTAVIGNVDSFGALTNESSITAALTSLRSSLAQAQLTTALYYPGIGIKQLTSPDGMQYTYEYDGMNRLSTVKDRNGKETDKYSYQNALTLTTD
jgi:YD repeat-containing protein